MTSDRVGRGSKKPPNIGRYRVKIVGHGRYVGRSKMAEKRRVI